MCLKMKRRLSEEEVSKLKKMWEEGVGVTIAARRLGIRASTAAMRYRTFRLELQKREEILDQHVNQVIEKIESHFLERNKQFYENMCEDGLKSLAVLNKMALEMVTELYETRERENNTLSKMKQLAQLLRDIAQTARFLMPAVNRAAAEELYSELKELIIMKEKILKQLKVG